MMRYILPIAICALSACTTAQTDLPKCDGLNKRPLNTALRQAEHVGTQSTPEIGPAMNATIGTINSQPLSPSPLGAAYLPLANEPGAEVKAAALSGFPSCPAGADRA
jgi:hypothetical protein